MSIFILSVRACGVFAGCVWRFLTSNFLSETCTYKMLKAEGKNAHNTHQTNIDITPNTHTIPIPNTHQYHHLLQFCSMIMFFTLSSVHASLKEFLEEEFECAICLESCTDTLVNPECNHRFCGKCIKESLHKCNHECPTCRVHIPTYRTCRRDPQFDHIVSTETK